MFLFEVNMSSARIVVKNVSSILSADIIGRVLSFFLIIVVARYLGDVGLGKYSFAFAFIALFSLFSDFGLSTLAIRDIAQDKKKTEFYYKNIISLKLFLSIITLVLTCISIFFLSESKEVIIIVCIAALATFFENFNYIFKALFQAYERMEFYSLLTVVERVIAVSLGITLLVKGYGIIALVSVFVISYATSFIIALTITLKKFTKIGFNINLKLWLYFIKKASPFWFTLMFMTIYFKIDTVMLTYFKGYAVTGWYNAAYKIIDALSFVSFAMVAAIFPTMSKFHSTAKELLKLLYEKTFKYLFILAFPIGIGTWLLANRIILFVYKEQFINSTLALQILIWAEVFIFVNYLMGNLLNSINKQKLFTLTAGICVIVNVILNFALIPKYSFAGAAIATVITQLVSFIFLFYFSSKNNYKLKLPQLIYKPIIAGVIMGIFIIYLSSLHILLIIPIAILVYFSSLFLMKAIGKEEINLFTQFIRKV